MQKLCYSIHILNAIQQKNDFQLLVPHSIFPSYNILDLRYVCHLDGGILQTSLSNRW